MSVILPVSVIIGGWAILEYILSIVILLLPLIWVGRRIWGCQQFGVKSFIKVI